MGSIKVSEHEQENLQSGLHEYFEISDDFKYIDLTDSAGYQSKTLPGIQHEVLLLSWFLVLARTHGFGDISFEWYSNPPHSGLPDKRTFRTLHVADLITHVQDSVYLVCQAISRHIRPFALQKDEDITSPNSLILRSSSSSETGFEQPDEGVFEVEAYFCDCRLEVRLFQHSQGVISYRIKRHVGAWIDMIRQCFVDPSASIESRILKPTLHDLDEIWSWNKALPPTYNQCMHDIIAERSRETPEEDAILSWDGSLTYWQIDEYSTQVACILRSRGIDSASIIPVCFEKSRWTVIAILGVMKAGATFVLLDPTIPILRLQEMVLQVDAKMIVTSSKQRSISETLLSGGQLLVVDVETFAESWSVERSNDLPTVSPSTIMYIIFTSGSTGVPKGVMISHKTYTSSAIPRANAVGYNRTSRVLDFASYAFDVSIDSMLCTLSQGGCLCIPSDEDRLNDLNLVIRNMRITYAGLTPSVARILDQDVISSLDCLGLGGEAVTAKDVAQWGKHTRIVIGYGPCECTIGCTINSSAACGQNYVSMGKGNGAVIWIVNPDDSAMLSPVGAVGELWVEGPIVGQGYLNDPEKTAVAFVEDPPWLLAGHEQYSGRRGRLYKTGDLVRYDPDGLGGIIFVGRKDTQVKLRGQRVELGEIEWQLKNILPPDISATVEVISPSGNGSHPMLVAFMAPLISKIPRGSSVVSVDIPKELSDSLIHASAKLEKILPRYMVPTIYIPINYLPVLISGKTDRKVLRQFGTSADLRNLGLQASVRAHQPLNDKERVLQKAWCQILHLEEDVVKPDNNFFALGGNSVAAMKLVSTSRELGFGLTVANVFLHPTLVKMAAIISDQQVQSDVATPAFSMVSCDPTVARLEAAEACGLTIAAIKDIYPCTPTQQSLFTFSLQSVKPYIAQRIFTLPSTISTKAWKKGWEDAVSVTPTMRVRVYRSQYSGLEQVVPDEEISWIESTSLAQYLEADKNTRMDLGQKLARYAIIEEPSENKRYMIWTIHHLLYDGWSEPKFLQKVSKALLRKHPESQQLQPQPQIRDFVRYLRALDETEVQGFWREYLQGAVGPQYPQLPSRHYVPSPDTTLEREVNLTVNIDTSFTMATFVRGAWALVTSQYTGSDDVVFCETFTGRDISLAGVENIEGPLIATTPVRVQINRASTIRLYLESLQKSVLSRAPFQHFGMQNIRKVSRDAEYACEARTGLVIQADSSYEDNELGLQTEDALDEALHFNPYPLMLACGIRTNGFRVRTNFDSRLIDASEIERLLAQLETAFIQLVTDVTGRVDAISCLPAKELDEIWRGNRVAPLSLDANTSRFRAGADIRQGSLYPPLAVAWVCDPRDTSRLSPIGCVGELWLEGPFSSGAMNSCPAWLVAGSVSYPGRKGRVQATGDLVQIQKDGSLRFVGRKEHILPIQGHSFDVHYLESQFRKVMPPEIQFAAVLHQSTIVNPGQAMDHKLILLVEQQPSEAEMVAVLDTDCENVLMNLETDGLELEICAKVPLGLVTSLRALNKHAEDTLQPYMIPFAYVVVSELPKASINCEDNLTSQVVSKIPLLVIQRIRESLRTIWAKRPETTKLTLAENMLLQAWATVLQMDADHIDVGDNFFRLGGDSVLAMKLVSNLRAQGQILTVADLFQNTRLCDTAKAMKLMSESNVKARHYEPFSLLGITDRESFILDVIRPRLNSQSWVIRDVLPVTDSQALDIRATIRAPRTSVQYTMLYFDSTIEQERLIRACNSLFETHDILRTVFVEHKTSFLQVVLDGLDLPIVRKQTDGNLEDYIQTLCAQEIESGRKLGSSFFQLFYIVGKMGQSCLVISLSHAQYDGISLPRLLRDLETLYIGESKINHEPFSSYIGRVKDADIQNQAIEYWRKLLHGSKLSILTDHANVNHNEKSIFMSKPVDVSSCPKEITMANLLTAAWALVLARHLQTTDVTFGNITSGRQLDMANVENVVGPCYQFTPVRVPFNPSWTGFDLMHLVQKQSGESSAYDFLGFDAIVKHCTSPTWPAETEFFNSIVHHQNFEDFDTMPFAGGTCRVEIMNPHGDAAYPFKVVSFVQKESLHVGVVGSGKDPGFVSAMLDKVIDEVQYLANSYGDILVLP